MTTALMTTALLATLLVVATEPAAAQDTRSEVQAILELDRQWNEAIAARKVDWIANLYAPKGQLMPPGAAAAEGREAVGAVWRAMLAAPGFSLTFAPTQIHVAGTGRHAYEIGTYESTSGTGDGATTDRGKYVVVWAKLDGRWQVVADIFNSNGPQAAASE